MTAIVGYVGRRGKVAPVQLCTAALAALSPFGPDGESLLEFDDGALGRRLYRTLPEDEFDRQPIAMGNGRLVFVADARVDDREELIRMLGGGRSNVETQSDSMLLAAAWLEWGFQSLEHVLGDFAVAIWDREDKALTLARSPLSLKPLFYCAQPDFTAFASLPAGLLAMEPVPRKLNTEHASAIIAECPSFRSTMFDSIESVLHGQAVRITSAGTKRVPLWDLRREPFRGSGTDFAQALREEFDRAVACRLRRRPGKVAAQLSSGRDSSAVATTAAKILAERGEELLAFTGAPRGGVSLPAIPNRIVDESALAARTASAHANIRHFVCRSSAASVVPLIEPFNAMHFGPMLNPANIPWWNAIDECVAAEGASILFVGSVGNYTISAGGLNHLPDLLRERGFISSLGRAGAIGGLSLSNWRRIAHLMLGSVLPEPMYRLIMTMSGRSSGVDFQVPLLRQPYRRAAEELLREQTEGIRRTAGFFEYRRKMLLDYEGADKGTLALWGHDLRDPTADRRVVELCFSAPIDQLVSRGSERPGYEAAFRDRIPGEVLLNSSRGLQSADWFEAFPKADVEAAFSRYGRNSLVQELLDMSYVRGLIERWPSSGWGPLDQVLTYRNKLLVALSVASFIDQHFPD